jgi:iron complex transport system ATP-binding protein
VVAMGREPYRKNFASLSKLDREKIDEAMEYTNCTHLKDRNIQLLSGGERQRVMIARTIVQDTPWIILDEPVSNLDIKHQYDLMLLLQRLRNEKSKTIVAILHDLNLAYSFCDRIILMKNGEIFAQGDTRQILTVENLKAVYEMEFEFVNGKNKSDMYIAVRYDS